MELLWAAVGWLLGIALNAVVTELPRSHRLWARPLCPRCEKPLTPKAFTAVPLPGASHCAACQAPIAPLWRSLEWPLALLFGTLAWRYEMTAPLLVYSLYAILLLVVLAIDLRHRWVYSIVCYPAALLGVVLSGVVLPSPWLGLVGAALGFAIFFVAYWAGRLFYKGMEPMGSGDITIATMIGAMAGPQRAAVALVLGSLIVGGVSIALLLGRRVRGHDFIPYGAGLCLGALVVLYLPDGW